MKTLKVLISAAEASSDKHGARALVALKKIATRHGIELEAFGVGGPYLRAAGLRAIVPAERLLSMGITEVLVRLPRLWWELRRISRAAKRERPDYAIVMDYPDFHFRLAKRLCAAQISVAYFIPPKVWVWRISRLRELRARFTKIFCILPFEVAFYQKHGIAAEYVGHPAVEELDLRITTAEARRRLGLAADARVVTVMLGSRPSEVRMHLLPVMKALALWEARTGEVLDVCIPLPEAILKVVPIAELQRMTESLSSRPERLHWLTGEAELALRAADAGIIKSGTSTLEAALFDCPHVVIYDAPKLTRFVFRHVVKWRGPVSLANLFLEGPALAEADPRTWLVPEFLFERLQPAPLADSLDRLLRDQTLRSRILDGFAKLRQVATQVGRPPSEILAEAIWREIEARQK